MLVLEPDPQKYAYYIVLAHVVQCRHVARNNQPFSATENLSARNLPSSATLSVALSPRNLPSSATLFPLYRPEIYHLAPLFQLGTSLCGLMDKEQEEKVASLLARAGLSHLFPAFLREKVSGTELCNGT